jgi:two-component system response regulator VicR
MKVLVIEDDSNIVDFISIAIKMGFPNSRVITTHRGKEGIDLVKIENPDIVLLDLELPDISGFDALVKIRSFSNVPVIIETIRDNETDIVKGLMLGADDYIEKPYGQLELMARIKTILRRASSYDEGKIYYGELNLDSARRILKMNNNAVNLTPTETLMMQTFLKNPNSAVTLEDLAQVIWGTDYPGSDNTIKVYIRRLRVKLLSVSDDKLNIHLRPGVGFILGSA